MKKILLVEDNPDNRDLVCAFLEFDYEITSFPSGHEALEYLGAADVEAPDVLLLDIALPGIDGVELLRRIRALTHIQRIPAIALTAHAMKGDEQRFMAAGFDAYVPKPIVDDQALIEAIEGLD
ncbi:MAG: response regulator [Gammaproteobacteria bacterium]